MSDFMERHFRHLRDGRKEYTEAEVRLIIEATIADEREACAKTCEELWSWNEDDPGSSAAKAIRARGETK